MHAALLIIAAAVLWGTTGTAQALGPDDVDPLVVGWIRLVIGGLGLALLARIGRPPRGPEPTPRAPIDRPWAIIAVLSVAAYQLTFFGGVRLAGVALGTAVGIGTAPLWGGVFDAVFTGWRPGRRWAAAAVVAISGAVLVAGSPGDAENAPLGLLLALGAGGSYALYAVALQRLAATNRPDVVTSRVFLAAAVLTTPLLVVAGADAISEVASPRGIGMSLHLGLVATTAAYALFTRGIVSVPVSTATLLSLSEPLTAVVLGVLVVGEALTMTAAGGVALLLVGVSIAATRPRVVAGAVVRDDVAVVEAGGSRR